MSERESFSSGSADSLWLARRARERRPLLVLAASATDAERLREEIAWFDPRLRVHRLPDWEILPFDQFSPHPDLVSERLATLWQFQGGDFDIGIVPVTTALQRLPPLAYLAGRTFLLRQKERLDLDKLRAQLVLAGYHHVQQVMSPGEFCVRGGLVDLFPTGSAVPYRLDLVGDEIESIKTFDVDTQRSIYPVPEVRMLPAREFPLDDEGRARFRENFRERFEGDPSRSRIYKDVSNGMAPAGVEAYLPLFFEATATLFDFLPPQTVFVQHGDVPGAAQAFWKDLKSRWELLRGDRDRPLLEPRQLYLPSEDLFIALAAFERDKLQADAAELPLLEVDRRSVEPLRRLKDFTSRFDGRVLIVAEGQGRRETLSRFFGEHDVHPVLLDDWRLFLDSAHPLALAYGSVATGFALPGEHLAVLTESELYPGQVRQVRRRDARARTSAEGMLRDLAEVKEGDPVVHSQHGIARYRGLVTMDLGEGAMEFLYLEYEGSDKLYVPVSQLHVISRYTGASPESAPLHRLGSGQWEKARAKAARQVRDTAAELLDLYAKRMAREGYAFPMTARDFEAFCAGFPFEETPDQLAAIEAVVKDMTGGRPMDRLICGDVGFGKTEVAMRAAFVAAAAGKQVAILVPTTLLAEQHFENFSDRFSAFPVKIAEFSRFRAAKEIEKGLEGLASGAVDIAIGTHKLLQKSVKFKDLGLVIIDEEHRFGVRQKEELKKLRAEVDVLTLTATPIPRTLAMSLEGLRDFSVIATAPQRRLSIKTFVNRLSAGIVREAVLRELKRGGQAYYLYNEVETIENRREELEKLLPEARIAVAHGQMRERDLERVMRDFYHQRSNLLLCSTIIETGIDVPSSNTILIHRADKFGLAQLHQLRGRVGRSHHQAYAYLLTPPEESLSASAKKRLEAIQSMEDLGAGFYLAMHDLEIRGAGEVLGESQSGGIHDVGFTLYTEMLESAVRSLKAGKEPDLSKPLSVATEVNLHSPALLPEAYCGDVHERLVLYKRLANCAAEADLDQLTEELVDRFGPLPDAARVLLDCHRLRIQGAPLGVAKIDASPSAIVVQFIPQPPVDPKKILALVQSSRFYKLMGPDRIRLEVKEEDLKARAREVRNFLGKALLMNLIVQGDDVETADLKALHGLAKGEKIERVSESAFRITRAHESTREAVSAHCVQASLDWGFVEEDRALSDFSLLAMDMDSTLISIECIDEIADFAGRKAEVATVTEAAMRGEIDWPESLRQRVAKLAGLEEAALGRVYNERLRFNSGAERLVAAARRAGVRTLLVSGGFTYFTDRVRDYLHIDHAYSNTLVIESGKLTGRVDGPLVDAGAKAAHVARLKAEMGISARRVLAIGDGANDLPMMAEAGTSIAYHAKPVVKAGATYSLDFSSLDGVLNLFPA